MQSCRPQQARFGCRLCYIVCGPQRAIVLHPCAAILTCVVARGVGTEADHWSIREEARSSCTRFISMHTLHGVQ